MCGQVVAQVKAHWNLIRFKVPVVCDTSKWIQNLAKTLTSNVVGACGQNKGS